MNWRSILAIGMFLSLLVGCRTTDAVVGHGPFQKRKYRPGWHVDLGHRSSHGAAAHGLRTSDDDAGTIALRNTERPITEPTPLAGPTLECKPVPLHTCLNTGDHAFSMAPPLQYARLALGHGLPQESDTQAEAPRYYNRMALVSGVFLVLSMAVIFLTGGGNILLYLLSFAFITGIIGLILAIKHKEKGKGIAIAAIVLPLVVVGLVIAALSAVF
ncbi:MAG: hypothetical protein IPH05_05315 [Flavobacteriales bacterium]|jgi:hypothetical protein|nr:hypothetical protein [Flavobacteriales bacterium]MBK6551825.1 hypothetical protein [Flavobacteriales bacterium]MBK6882352.1 hypothetical protein [Flavobacteriales bacterium]MBK7481856.1 hypothetical protein [Flavobacteriales bacterium]MBK7618839.1 hypothetical protein [Flavobacteriales bacterium]